MNRIYKVTYAIDSLDNNPTIKIFDEWHEMQNWISEEVNNRVQWTVEHSPYSISENELEQLEEQEYSLINIEEIHTTHPNNYFRHNY
tara:strand:+ start:609 stop:869 length:261 start_codon:yes stop_codon:yes gene_type:complete